MSWVVGLLARWGLGDRAARIAGGVLAVAAAIALLGLLAGIWLHFHDRSVVRQHEAGVNAAVSISASSAEWVANANDQLRGMARMASDQDLRKAIDHAETTQPDKVRAAAGPAVNAVAERLRQQRANRDAGP